MNFQMTGGSVVALAGVAFVGVAAYLLVRKGEDTASKLADAFNPMSDKNLAYKAVNAVGSAATGDSSFALGSWLYDKTHVEYDPNADLKAVPAASNINPMNMGIGIGGWGFGGGPVGKTSDPSYTNYDPAYIDKLLNGSMTLDDYLTPPQQWSFGGYK